MTEHQYRSELHNLVILSPGNDMGSVPQPAGRHRICISGTEGYA
jgi:hypothetical protein